MSAGEYTTNPIHNAIFKPQLSCTVSGQGSGPQTSEGMIPRQTAPLLASQIGTRIPILRSPLSPGKSPESEVLPRGHLFL